MRGLRRALVKVLVLVPLAVFAVLLAVGPGDIVSYTPTTRVGVHSVLAFWISIPTALGILAYQRRPIRASVVMLSALIFAVVLHIGSAAKNILRIGVPTVERFLVDTTLDLLEFALYAVLITGSLICFLVAKKGRMSVTPGIVSFIIVMPLVIYGVAALVVPILAQELLLAVSYVVGAIAVVGFLTVSLLVFRFPPDEAPFDPGYFVSAILLLCVAAVATMSNLVDPSLNWEFAETLQMAAFLLVCVSLAVPFLKRFGYRRRSAYGLTTGLILMAYLPFLLTITLESMGLNVTFEEGNVFAYSIIHIGAAFLSTMMAILLYIYPKKETSWNHDPMILIFLLWTVIASLLSFYFSIPSVTLRGEPITPIVIGSIITLALLLFTIRWTITPRTGRPMTTLRNHALHISFFVILIVFGEFLNQVVLNANPLMEDSPYGSLLLLGSSLIVMSALTYLIFLLAENSGGKSPVEMYVIFFLGMWILPNILKSYYDTWTTGWWVSEILLFVGLLAGPPLLIWLYVRSMHEVEDSRKRANMYADLLMHDVSNYNQMMMMSMELLGSQDISHSQRTRLADDGRQVISFSEQLISNVRLLSEADQLEFGELEPTNLVTTIVSALDIFTRRIGSGELVMEFQPEEPDASVMANELLVHIFLNILYSALECRKRGETVKIRIHETMHSDENYWQIDITAPGRSADQEDGYSSGTLGLLAARLMTESLKGYFSMGTFERTDICEGRLFSIRLHSTNA